MQSIRKIQIKHSICPMSSKCNTNGNKSIDWIKIQWMEAHSSINQECKWKHFWYITQIIFFFSIFYTYLYRYKMLMFATLTIIWLIRYDGTEQLLVLLFIMSMVAKYNLFELTYELIETLRSRFASTKWWYYIFHVGSSVDTIVVVAIQILSVRRNYILIYIILNRELLHMTENNLRAYMYKCISYMSSILL